jgi:serine/threonine protein phosphatase PrpC
MHDCCLLIPLFSLSRAPSFSHRRVRAVLIHRPDITSTPLSHLDQFIICGSDGLWDVLTNETAVEYVLQQWRKYKNADCKDIATKLVQHAYSIGSEDNITATIVFFCNNDITCKQ